MNKLRIMLVDDHTVLRAGLKLLLDNQPDMEVVADTGDSREVLALADAALPEVIVLDLSLPGGPSLPLLEQLAGRPQAPRVIVLTMHDEPAYVRAALSARARGYIVKTIGENDLLQAIRAVTRGQLVIDLDDQLATDSVFQPGPPGVGSDRMVTGQRLSAREVEVLRLLGQGFSNQAISERLELSPKTVATYRARIADKLGLKSTADYVKYAVDTGLLTPGGSAGDAPPRAPDDSCPPPQSG